MPTSHSRRALIASLASALALPVIAGSQEGPPGSESGEKVKCYGVNKCKGVGDCGGKERSCAGTNECRRQGFIEMDKETCLRIDGSRLTPEADKAAPKEKEKKENR